MSKHLLRAFAAQDPERFAELLGTSDDVNTSLEILTDIPDGMECDVVSRLTPEAAGRLLNGLADRVLVSWLESASLDAGHRLLSRVGADRSTRLIQAVSGRSKRRGLRRLAGYPAGSVGELIQTQMLVIKENSQAVDIAREIQRLDGTLEGPIVVESVDGALLGVLDLVRFVQNQDVSATAADFCIPVRPVYPDSPCSALDNPANWTGLTTLPVVDHEGKPIGYVTRSALENATGTKKRNDPALSAFVELSKRFWEVSAALLAIIFDRRVDH